MRLTPHLALASLTFLATAAGCGSSFPTRSAHDQASPHLRSHPYKGAQAQGDAEDSGRAAPAVASESVATEASPADGARHRKSKPARGTLAMPRPMPPPPAPLVIGGGESPGTEHYTDYGVNGFVQTEKDHLSTFAVDVDTGSYTVARSKLTRGTLPPFQAVRAEEFINYFDYDYRGPSGSPFGVHLAAAPSPFRAGRHILRVGVQAKRIDRSERKPVHLVYLVDTSGSMRSPNKLGLAKRSLRLLTSQLNPSDTVALCTYAGSTRIVLSPTGVNNRDKILRAIDNLTARGGTAMSSGIDLAYGLANQTLVDGHVNRIIVLSDGDANIGRTSHQAILRRIAEYRQKGITLSTVGFGRGNYKDTMMEQLANKGNGNYSYIDTAAESRRVFGEQLGGLLQVVARDAKIQVDFDPSLVRKYRLIGYENRDVADRDFRNDHVDAGEIGAGHNVTALYEVVFNNRRRPTRSPVTVRIRYKQPTGSEKAAELAFRMRPEMIASTFNAAPRTLRLATAVAGFAEVLRKSPYAKQWSLSTIASIARNASSGKTEHQELLRLVASAQRLLPTNKPQPLVIAR